MKIITYQELDPGQDQNILEQVEYRGEGNSSIVIALKDRAQVIKLAKRHLGPCDSKNLNQLLQSSLENVIYIDNIFTPLAGPYMSANFKLIYLKPSFINALHGVIEPHRPLQRLDKSLIIHDQYAMLMNDLCSLPKFITNHLRPDDLCGPTFSVEIKPKQGFLPIVPSSMQSTKSDINFMGHEINTSEQRWLPGNSCLFGSNQYLKLLRGQIKRLSGYCPIDLFSGCPKRMKNAIRQLIFNPQNNFRIFKNLDLVYHDQKPMRLTDAIQDMFGINTTTSGIATKNQKIDLQRDTETSDSDAENRFVDLLCRMLLNKNESDEYNGLDDDTDHDFDYTEELKEDILNATCDICLDHLSLRKCKRCNPINDHSPTQFKQNIESNSIKEMRISPHELTKKSVLYHVLKAQQLDTIGIHRATYMLDWLLKNNNPEMVLDQLSCPCKPPGFGSSHQLAHESRYDFYIRKVWEFLVSMTAKDCSLMITFQGITTKCQKHIEQNVPELKNNLLTEKTTGLYYLYSIGLTDLDKKKPTKLPVIRDNFDISHKIRLEHQATNDQNLDIGITHNATS